jgi:hypothetical protein
MAKFILVAALALLMVGGALAQGTKTPPKATPAVPSPRATMAHMKHHKKHHVVHHRKHHHKHVAKMSPRHELKASNGSAPEKLPMKHKAHRGASHLRTSTGRSGGAVPSKTTTNTSKSMMKESTKARTVVSTKKATTKTSQKGTVQRK